MGPVAAVGYEVKVYEGLMDAVHGGGTILSEIFIPSVSVIVNPKGGIFHAEKSRNIQPLFFNGPEVEKPLKDVELPPELAKKIEMVANMKLDIVTRETQVMAELKELKII